MLKFERITIGKVVKNRVKRNPIGKVKEKRRNVVGVSGGK